MDTVGGSIDTYRSRFRPGTATQTACGSLGAVDAEQRLEEAVVGRKLRMTPASGGATPAGVRRLYRDRRTAGGCGRTDLKNGNSSRPGASSAGMTNVPSWGSMRKSRRPTQAAGWPIQGLLEVRACAQARPGR